MNDYIYHFICDICDRIQTRERERHRGNYWIYTVSSFKIPVALYLLLDEFLAFHEVLTIIRLMVHPESLPFPTGKYTVYICIRIYLHCEETCWWLLIYHFYRCLYLFHSSNLRPSLSANLHPHLTSFNEICLAKSEKKHQKPKPKRHIGSITKTVP